MMLNKILIQWFWVDVTTKLLESPQKEAFIWEGTTAVKYNKLKNNLFEIIF